MYTLYKHRITLHRKYQVALNVLEAGVAFANVVTCKFICDICKENLNKFWVKK